MCSSQQCDSGVLMEFENTKRLWGSAKAGLSPSMTYSHRRELNASGDLPLDAAPN